MKKERYLPKEKQVKQLEEQDKILASLPNPHKEERFLKRVGIKLKHMIKRKKVSVSELHRIEDEVEEAGKSIEKPKRKKTKKKPQKKGGKK